MKYLKFGWAPFCFAILFISLLIYNCGYLKDVKDERFFCEQQNGVFVHTRSGDKLCFKKDSLISKY